MKFCIKCGISDEKVALFEVITYEGVSSACKECSEALKLPVISNKGYSFEKIDKGLSVYERLSRMKGISPVRMPEKNDALKKEEITLREIVEKNFRNSKKIDSRKNPNDLIYNFHWVIMRVRRGRHLTQEDLALSINEPVIIIKNMEKGILQENYHRIAKKLEDSLGISIFKDEPFHEQKKFGNVDVKILDKPRTSVRENLEHPKIQNKPGLLSRGKIQGFFDISDKFTASNIKISDLNELRKLREKEDIENKKVGDAGGDISGITSSKTKEPSSDANKEDRKIKLLYFLKKIFKR